MSIVMPVKVEDFYHVHVYHHGVRHLLAVDTVIVRYVGVISGLLTMEVAYIAGIAYQCIDLN